MTGHLILAFAAAFALAVAIDRFIETIVREG